MTHPALSGFFRRDWRISRSYRYPFVAGLVASLLSLSIFFYLSNIVQSSELPATSGGEEGYFAYAIVGIVLADLVAVGTYTTARRMREELMAGTLEIVAAAPTPTSVMAVGSVAYELVYGALSGLVSAAVAIVIFDVSFDVRLATTPALLLATVATLGFTGAVAIAVAALTIVLKQTAAIASFVAAVVVLLSGVYFPTELLPEPLSMLSWASPYRWSLDVVRPALFGHSVPVGELVALIGACALALPASFALFEAALRRAKRTGSLVQY